ncbi:MAG: hypothetical protein AVDCRST_MAG73-3568 [uncultured Thermomicrobiales bacterium]|uniref:Response regulatory domain-containing protein n=1 Tax=uncultured Thermomicrobiales bacterium TaxID=1645740 RepID=A0A6J4UW69_9BACT|nr:MAG: hypothetical protein AVDCRST_MAG73-3568 [uncultured Thermomicrobiales bacterium]
MDVRLPVVTGLQVAAALRRQRPAVSIVFLSMHADDERRFAAIRAGAAGFLTEDAEPSAILEAVHAVLRGENPLQAESCRRPASPAASSASSAPCPSGPDPTAPRTSPFPAASWKCSTAW